VVSRIQRVTQGVKHDDPRHTRRLSGGSAMTYL
jgi:hypothetical protein